MKSVVLFFLICNVNLTCLAQEGKYDKKQLQQLRLKYVDSIYNSHIVPNQLLRHGRLYTYSEPHTRGDQFLIGRHSEEGSITFNEMTFKGVVMNYDIFNDEVVMNIVGAQGLHRVVLVDKNRISSFTYKNRHFVNTKDSLELMKGDGFYEQAFAGVSSKFLIKRRKILQNLQGSVVNVYTPKDFHYIITEFGTKRINGKKDLLNALNGDSQVRAYIKKYRIKLTKELFEKNIITVLKFYESLPDTNTHASLSTTIN